MSSTASVPTPGQPCMAGMPTMSLLRLLTAAVTVTVLAACAEMPRQNSTVGLHAPNTPAATPADPRSIGLRPQSFRGSSDMWERLRRGFAMPDLDTPEVRSREDWYAQRPDYIERMIGRSNKYMYHVIEELERRGMPSEIALLPFVESAFNPQALSSAKAAGLWQFIPSTGRDYDLKQNMFQDDRRHVLRSTRAALDYLQKLYAMFGDWHLALAAYNWGEGNVQRALRRNPGASYATLPMPQETRQYVPKLQAIKNIIRNPANFNASLPEVANHPYFDTVTIPRDMDVAVAARLAEISEADFRALNPAMNRPLIIATLNPRILLPWDSVPTFRRNLAAVGDRPLSSWTAWTVPTHMTAAEAARHIGASEQTLRSVNRIPANMRIRAGSTLLVPRADGQHADIPSIVAHNASLSLVAPPVVTPEIVLRRTSVRARAGDSIASIAKRYGLSAATVANWNKTNARAKLRAGQTVVLSLPRQKTPTRAAVASSQTRATATVRGSAKPMGKAAGKPSSSKTTTTKTSPKTSGKAGKPAAAPASQRGRAASAKTPAKAPAKASAKTSAKGKKK